MSILWFFFFFRFCSFVRLLVLYIWLTRWLSHKPDSLSSTPESTVERENGLQPQNLERRERSDSWKLFLNFHTSAVVAQACPTA